MGKEYKMNLTKRYEVTFVRMGHNTSPAIKYQ